MNPLLQVNNLEVQFAGNKNAVNNISFDINEGECLAIVGESGSGKSATALSFLQLLPQDATTKGRVIYKNIDLLQLSSKEINRFRGRNISMIFQEPMSCLNPLLTCGEQVQEAILCHTNITKYQARNEVINLFKKVKLNTPEIVFSSYPHQLSGGQKQRVMIAMAISCKPELLIADEPTTALDPTVQKSIILLLKEIAKEQHLSLLLISHDLSLVNQIADRVMVMLNGTIIETEKTSIIIQHPAHAYTQELIKCSRAFSERKITRTPQPTSAALRVKNLQAGYPLTNGTYLDVLKNISFEVMENSITGIVGESGCGKSTLLKSILQFIPSKGEVIFMNRNLHLLPKKQLQKIRTSLQVVFQDPYSALNPSITVGKAIEEPLHTHNIANIHNRKEIVLNMLQKLELSADIFDKYPHELSGGQKQRVNIARALIMNPSFVIFDECIAALDVTIQLQVLNIIKKLKDDLQFSALFISHNIAAVQYISDKILVMQKGEIVEQGATSSIFNKPSHPYTQMLVSSVPDSRQ